MISHSQDFMNGVCTNIIHMADKKLKYYGVSKYTQPSHKILCVLQIPKVITLCLPNTLIHL